MAGQCIRGCVVPDVQRLSGGAVPRRRTTRNLLLGVSGLHDERPSEPARCLEELPETEAVQDDRAATGVDTGCAGTASWCSTVAADTGARCRATTGARHPTRAGSSATPATVTTESNQSRSPSTLPTRRTQLNEPAAGYSKPSITRSRRSMWSHSVKATDGLVQLIGASQRPPSSVTPIAARLLPPDFQKTR